MSAYPQLKGTRRLRILPRGDVELTVRCRLGISKRFGILDRLRFLWKGRVFVATVNGKEHTTVVLTMTRPKDTNHG